MERAGCQGANSMCDCPGQTPLAGIHVDYSSSIGLSQLIAWVVKYLIPLTLRYPVWRDKQSLSAVLVLPVLCLDWDFSDSGICMILESCKSSNPMSPGSDNCGKNRKSLVRRYPAGMYSPNHANVSAITSLKAGSA